MTSGMAYEFNMSYIQESSGSIADTCGSPSTNDSMPRSVLEKTESITNPSLRSKTVSFVSLLKYYMSLDRIEFELPRIVTDFHETDAYMEWIFPHFTIGFNMSTDKSQDGWFVVTDASLDNYKASHYSSAPLDQIVEFVERFGDN